MNNKHNILKQAVLVNCIMEVGASHMKRRSRYFITSSGWAVFLLLCSFFIWGCGTPADHPLTLGTATTIDVGNGTESGSGALAPIQVVDAQTNLTAYPGGSMSLAITTTPYAACSFVVSYGHAKPSTVAGIEPITANSDGMVSWHWHVEETAHTGTWPLIISAVLANGAKASSQVSVTITFPPFSVISSQSKLAARPGGFMELSITAIPYLSCTIQYAFGAGRPVRSLTQKADKHGVASWNWNVDKEAVVGVYPLTIVATLADGEQSSIQENMTIY